jgi:hypothetical protein
MSRENVEATRQVFQAVAQRDLAAGEENTDPGPPQATSSRRTHSKPSCRKPTCYRKKMALQRGN